MVVEKAKGIIRTRVIVCVDGTYCDADGADTGYQGNATNVFRISEMVQKGCVQNGTWNQVVGYFNGLNNLESWFGKKLTGAFGRGIDEQIFDVYQYCCRMAATSEDEIFFFGFSRGAFVVRAVASLLHWIKIPRLSVESPEFRKTFKKALSLYKAIRAGTSTRDNSILDYYRRCRDPPNVKFIGVFDTVKAYADDNLFDIGLNSTIHHTRHALALHEERKAFSPELWSVSKGSDEYVRRQQHDYSMLQAWFIGTHSDMGGGNAKDGLSLYPLQWIISEACDVGLAIGGFVSVTWTDSLGKEHVPEDPAKLVFPELSGQANSSTSTGPYEFENSNGIVSKIWDLRRVHNREDKHYRICINKARVSSWVFHTATRTIFDSQQKLHGYEEEGMFSLAFIEMWYPVFVY